MLLLRQESLFFCSLGCSLGFSFGILVSRQAIYILVSLHLRILETYIFVVLESLFLDNKKEPLWVALNLFSYYGM